MAKLTISQSEYQKLRDAGQSQQQIIAKYSEKPVTAGGVVKTLGKALMTGANAVTDFVGARGIAEQYGSSMARTGLNISGNKEAAQLVGNPSLKKVVGSAIQTGANFIPGAGAGTSLLTKVGAGLATGYAFDVGNDLQQGKSTREVLTPDAGTVVGGMVPILGKILGYSTKNLPEKLAKKLEDTSLRLTPVERQNLAKKGQDIVSYLSKKKVIGSPEVRYAKVSGLYDDMERTIQSSVDKAKVTLPKSLLVDELQKIPDAFIDDPELASEAATTVGRLIKSLQEHRGDSLSTGAVNKLKRNYMERAFAKNATDVVSDSRLAIASLLNGELRKAVPALEALNREYGTIIASRRALQKALSRPQIGLTGKIAGIAAGSAIGNMVAPGVGTAAGAVVGPTIGKVIAGTRARSTLGAGAQTIANLAEKIQSLPVDRLGNISQKAVLNLLQSLKQ